MTAATRPHLASPSPAQTRVGWLGGVLGIVVALLVPLFVIFTSARLVIASDLLYRWGFESFGISRVTGISDPELMNGARDIVRYFSDDRERLDTVVQKDGRPFTLFNEREILHMVDVKAIMQVIYRIQLVSSIGLLGSVFLATVLRPLRRGVWRGLFLGSVGTLLFALLAVLAASVDFSTLFLQFHLLSFDNDLWILDPRTDYLIMMFPQGFFLGAALAIGAGALLLTLALAGTSWQALRRA